MPGEGEVVVKVAAAALNFFDTLLIAGKYQVKPDFPFSPAAEFAGIVHSVGAGVTGWKPGDRVMGYSAYGAAREFYRDQGLAAGAGAGQSRSGTRGRIVGHLRHHHPCAEGSREA